MTELSTTTLSVKLNKENKNLDYLKLINGILGLSVKEIEVLSSFMDLSYSSMCDTKDRKKIIDKFNLKNINVYIKTFKDKKLIKPVPGKWGVYSASSLIIPPSSGLKINIGWK